MEAGTRWGRGSSPTAPASQTSPGAWVRRASMYAQTGTNEATDGGNTDVWFVGFTPQIATAVWIGNPAAQTNMKGGRVQGGTVAGRVWHEFMAPYLEDAPAPRPIAAVHARVLREGGEVWLELAVSPRGEGVEPVPGLDGLPGTNLKTAEELDRLTREGGLRLVERRDGRSIAGEGPFVTRAARADLYGDALNEELLMRPGDRFVTGLVDFDDHGVDGAVDGTGRAFAGMSGTFRRLQNGYVRSYALSVLSGAVVVVAALLAVNLT